MLNNICVFCGSNSGFLPQYRQQAEEMGRFLAFNGKTLVYGGGNVGLMGVIADEVLKHNGKVIGVIPDFLIKKEVGHTGLTELVIVQTMHERKQRMSQLADAFVMLPGGIGTLEEFFEVFTWGQLGLHAKPIGILNTEGYYEHLLAFLNHAVAHRFLSPHNQSMMMTDTTCTGLFTKLNSYTAPQTEKWLENSKT